MDLKVLFHNPEELTDAELAFLRDKIRMQRSMPWLTAFFGGFGVYFLDRGVIRRSHDIKRVAAGALVGFILGAYGSYQVGLPAPGERQFDREIIGAYEKRYVNTVLNATGFGSNYVSTRDYGENYSLKKPY